MIQSIAIRIYKSYDYSESFIPIGALSINIARIGKNYYGYIRCTRLLASTPIVFHVI